MTSPGVRLSALYGSRQGTIVGSDSENGAVEVSVRCEKLIGENTLEVERDFHRRTQGKC